jgi:hypothetical protein
MNHDEAGKYAVDAAMAATTLGAILGWLPAVAAVLTIIWTMIRIYETRTVQRWLGRQ